MHVCDIVSGVQFVCVGVCLCTSALCVCVYVCVCVCVCVCTLFVYIVCVDLLWALFVTQFRLSGHFSGSH